ncbi:MAG: hypothetical protein WC621_05425 [Patescibacteria group bacterium]
MASILIGLIMAIVGFMLIWKTDWFVNNFGRISWSEAHLGSDGGTRLFYKLIGLTVILLGFATITGLFQSLLLTLVSPLFGGLK